MVKKSIFLTVYLLLFTLTITIAQSKFTLSKTYYLPCDYFQCDQFGNIYTISKSTLVKYDSLGEKVALYDQNRNGVIGNIDLSNPLKILLFYPERSKVLFLDRKLAQIEEEIDLFALLNETFSQSCVSYSNSLWAYSQSGLNLIRINQQAVVTTKIENLNQTMFENFIARQIIEEGDYLYLGNPNFGIVIFDRWGAIIKQIPLKYQERFQVLGDQLFYHRNDTAFYYTPNNFEEVPIIKAQSEIKQTFATKSNLYIQLKSDTIFRYTLK
jgi:hypothetical protein